MSTEFDTARTLDVHGESCPTPVVRTKGAIDGLDRGEVIEVIATGSMSDVENWASDADGVELLSSARDGRLETHYIRKTE